MTRARCRLLAGFVVLVLGCGAGPVSAQTNVAGDWELTIQSPMGPRTTPVSLKQDGEKVTGAFKSPAGEVPITGTLTGDDLKLAFSINVQGNPIDITMAGKVEDSSKIAGTAQFGAFGEGEFTAKRAAATTTTSDTATSTTTPPDTTATAATTTEPSTSATTAVGIAGTWIVTIMTPGGELPATTTLAEEGGKLSGTFGSQMGEVPVTGTLEGKAVTLSMIAKTPQGDLTVSMTGDLEGDSIVNGKAEVPGLGQMQWTARRKQ